MRIAMISEHAGLSGDGVQQTDVTDLSSALTELGHEVRVYIRRDDPGAADETSASGVRMVHLTAGPAVPLPTGELLPHMAEFARRLEESWHADGWRPDVLHAHFWTSGLAAVTAAKHVGVPVVQSFHELGAIEKVAGTPSRAGYERALGRAVDRVVAQSQDEVSGLVRIGVPRARLTVVPTGVDSVRFSPEGPAVPRDPDRPRILTVGRLVEHKGVSDVLQAMRYVPGAEVVVVGGPPADQLKADPGAGALRQLAERLQIADRFRLVGRVSAADLPSWYRSADLLVTADYEPSTLEAMACGVPVVGPAVGGLTEAVVDGLTGDLVPARDPRALGSAVRRLVNDKVRRFAYATAAIDRARQAYSWKRVAAQIGSVYAAVTGRKAGAEEVTA